ncbi:hypothetical protein Plhal304r1_c006g0026321 [Plasmopara halstedii]
MLYLSKVFVPGTLAIPRNASAEDLLLRLYSEWLALPIMICLLLPLKCMVIGFEKAKSVTVALPLLILYCIASSVITIQLNCESSPPTPTLWTHVRYASCACTEGPTRNGKTKKRVRLTGTIKAVWTSVLALIISIIDDPTRTDCWHIGALVISAIAGFWILISNSKYFWHQLASTTKMARSPLFLTAATKIIKKKQSD